VLHEAGAQLAFPTRAMCSRTGDAIGRAAEARALIDCDVSSQPSIDAAFGKLGKVWTIWISWCMPSASLTRSSSRAVTWTPRPKIPHDNGHQLLFLHRRRPARREDDEECGAMVTMTYYGSEKVMPHYNVMGVAKAALEASVRYMAEDLGKKGIRSIPFPPVRLKTLAASGWAISATFLKWNEFNAPLRRTVTIDEVGHSALYLVSDMAAPSPANACTSMPAIMCGHEGGRCPDIAVRQKNGA